MLHLDLPTFPLFDSLPINIQTVWLINLLTSCYYIIRTRVRARNEGVRNLLCIFIHIFKSHIFYL